MNSSAKGEASNTNSLFLVSKFLTFDPIEVLC